MNAKIVNNSGSKHDNIEDKHDIMVPPIPPNPIVAGYNFPEHSVDENIVLVIYTLHQY